MFKIYIKMLNNDSNLLLLIIFYFILSISNQLNYETQNEPSAVVFSIDREFNFYGRL